MGKKLQKPMPVRTKTIELTGDYEGWEFEARLNPPLSVFGDLASGEFVKIAPALSKVVRSWNFIDEDGVPMPNPTMDLINELPLELVTEMSNKFISAITELSPN